MWWARRHCPQVTVYVRRSCTSCQRAEAIVTRLARRARVRYVDVDRETAEDDPIRVRVPVTLVDGHEVAELGLDAATLRSALRTARRAR